MLKARTNHASAALNGEIYAIGGELPPLASCLLPALLTLCRRAASRPHTWATCSLGIGVRLRHEPW